MNKCLVWLLVIQELTAGGSSEVVLIVEAILGVAHIHLVKKT